MNTLIVAPLLIPLATLVATLLARRAPRAVTALSLAGALARTAAGLVLVGLAAQGQILATQAGGWAAPYGITLVIEKPFKRTCLDGAAMLYDGRPIVALTLRHDRIDNFWFALLHELAHVARHLTPESSVFIDDLDRCLPAQAVQVLEAVKLFLDKPGCIYLLGADVDLIQKAVASHELRLVLPKIPDPPARPQIALTPGCAYQKTRVMRSESRRQ